MLAGLESFALATVRISMFLMLSPPFSHGAVPMRVRGALAALLAIVCGASVDSAAADGGEFLGRLVTEGLMGAALGFMVLLVISAIQTAGRMIDSFGGFELGAAFDPLLMTQGGPFGRFYQLFAVVLLFASSGYQLIILGMIRTFEILPLGAGQDLGVLAGVLTSSLGSMMLAALQIAGPLIAVLFLTDVGMGLLTRVAPALNVFVLGFPVKILLTLTLSGFAIATMPQIVSWLVDEAVSLLAGG